MGDVEIGLVAELDPRLSSGDEPRRGRDWWAVQGEGAFRDGERLPPLRPGPLELLGLETARPELVAAAAAAIESVGARRLRALGSVAMTLCLVAAGARRDAQPAPGPLGRRGGRPADRAEAGGAVALPGGRRAGARDALARARRARRRAPRAPAHPFAG